MRPGLALAAALLLFAAPLGHAHGITAGTVEIIHPHIPAPPATARSAAVYMGIANAGETAERLIAVETPAAERATLHATEHGADGIARMIRLDAIEIPAGDTVVLEPGGLHIMLMGLTATLHEGDMVPATLVFEHAGRVAVEFMVDPAVGADHGHMDHGTTGAGG